MVQSLNQTNYSLVHSDQANQRLGKALLPLVRHAQAFYSNNRQQGQLVNGIVSLHSLFITYSNRAIIPVESRSILDRPEQENLQWYDCNLSHVQQAASQQYEFQNPREGNQSTSYSICRCMIVTYLSRYYIYLLQTGQAY